MKSYTIIIKFAAKGLTQATYITNHNVSTSIILLKEVVKKLKQKYTKIDIQKVEILQI